MAQSSLKMNANNILTPRHSRRPIPRPIAGAVTERAVAKVPVGPAREDAAEQVATPAVTDRATDRAAAPAVTETSAKQVATPATTGSPATTVRPTEQAATLATRVRAADQATDPAAAARTATPEMRVALDETPSPRRGEASAKGRAPRKASARPKKEKLTVYVEPDLVGTLDELAYKLRKERRRTGQMKSVATTELVGAIIELYTRERSTAQVVSELQTLLDSRC